MIFGFFFFFIFNRKIYLKFLPRILFAWTCCIADVINCDNWFDCKLFWWKIFRQADKIAREKSAGFIPSERLPLAPSARP